jgi:putative endonuclease
MCGIQQGEQKQAYACFFVMFYLYILHSAKSNQFYVGITDNPKRRLCEHNSSPRQLFTSPHRPWSMEALFHCSDNLGDAMKVERFIKKQKSRSLLLRLRTTHVPQLFLCMAIKINPDPEKKNVGQSDSQHGVHYS